MNSLNSSKHVKFSNWGRLKAIFGVMNTTWAVVKTRPEKNSGLYGIRTYYPCDNGAVLYQLS